MEEYNPWQDRIAESKEETEAWLAQQGYNWEFDEVDTLNVWRTLPAFQVHPITGETIIFCQPHSQNRTYVQIISKVETPSYTGTENLLEDTDGLLRPPRRKEARNNPPPPGTSRMRPLAALAFC